MPTLDQTEQQKHNEVRKTPSESRQVTKKEEKWYKGCYCEIIAL